MLDIFEHLEIIDQLIDIVVKRQILEHLNEFVNDHIRIIHLMNRDIFEHLEIIDQMIDIVIVREIVEQINEFVNNQIFIINLVFVRDMINHIISQNEFDLSIILVEIDLIKIKLVDDVRDDVRIENEIDLSHDMCQSKKVMMMCLLVDMLIIIVF